MLQEAEEGEGESEGPAPEEEDHAAAIGTALPSDDDDDFEDEEEDQVNASAPLVHAAGKTTRIDLFFQHCLRSDPHAFGNCLFDNNHDNFNALQLMMSWVCARLT